jgi:hypothetical protein
MSNGFLVAAAADADAVREIGDGFGLAVIDAGTIADVESAIAELASAANVGLVLSNAAANDVHFVAFAQALGARLPRAQLIVVEPDAREKFAFLPAMWPVMALDEARARAAALGQQRVPQTEEPAPVEQETSAEEAPPQDEAPPAPQDEELPGTQNETPTEAPSEEPAPSDDGALLGGLSDVAQDDNRGEPPIRERGITIEPEPELAEPEREQDFGAGGGEAPTLEDAIPAPPPAAEPPAPPPQVAAPPAAEPVAPPEAPRAPAPSPERDDASAGAALPPKSSPPRSAPPPSVAAPSAPADATAFAPKKLRRGTPELVRIVVHQPKDLNAVIKAAKKIDPRTDAAPQGMPLGDVALGATIGVSLEVRGAACDGVVQRRSWQGEPIDFCFSAEADEGVKQVVFLARVFINDAQIGVLAFTRNVSGPNKKPHSDGDRVRLKRHKRVFLSYSSKDRETVSQIATAYASAGVEHFWDRASLKSGEEWHPRLRREIDRADLFHVCWSKNAAESEWVKKETEHAITRRRRNSGKPDITVQMLDGPPWAKHPPELDSINFDDFVRAAIVGYARGDGSET